MNFQVSQMNRLPITPSGGPNVQKLSPMPLLGGAGMPIDKPAVMPSGGPNVPQQEPFDFITRAVCGLPPMPTQTPMQPRQFDNNMSGLPVDIFNKDMSFFGGGGMAPSTPKAIDFGLGTQQMDTGNEMGGINNWFSNFAPPAPMPAPMPAAPAPMMPMKGMFGVR